MLLESIKNRFNLRLRDQAQDCLFLSIIILFSAVLYVWHLGFYTDDWTTFGRFVPTGDLPFTELFRQKYDAISRQRPVQVFYWVVLYQLFGFNPLGYHLVNLIVLAAGIVLFYLVLREFIQDRLLSLVIPLVYGLLPHYSTDRFWYTGGFHVVLSMTLYFLCLYSNLKALNSKSSSFWMWQLLSIVSLLGSTLSYEIFLPLFLLNPVLLLYRKRQLARLAPSEQISKIKLVLLLSSNLLTLFLVIVFKALITTRIGNFSLSMQYIKSLIKNSLIISYGDYGFGLPKILWKILYNYFNPAIFTFAVVFGLVVLWYIYRVVNPSKVEFLKWDTMLKLTGLGLIIFGFGYAIFLSNGNVGFSPTGLSNRTAMAAAVGVAFSLVGGVGWVSSFWRSNYARRRFFCLLIALLCTSGFLINNTIASFWISAYRQQLAVLSDVRTHFATPPAGSTILLDGVCPYIGPGIVFETNWDTSGGLRATYRNSTLQGDIVKPSLIVKEDGILMPSKAFGDYHYPYKQLFVYNVREKNSYQLADAKTAQRYFAQFSPNSNHTCPEGYPDYGVPLF